MKMVMRKRKSDQKDKNKKYPKGKVPSGGKLGWEVRLARIKQDLMERGCKNAFWTIKSKEPIVQVEEPEVSAALPTSCSSPSSNQSLEWDPLLQTQPLRSTEAVVAGPPAQAPNLQEEMLTADIHAESSPKSSDDSKGK